MDAHTFPDVAQDPRRFNLNALVGEIHDIRPSIHNLTSVNSAIVLRVKVSHFRDVQGVRSTCTVYAAPLLSLSSLILFHTERPMPDECMES